MKLMQDALAFWPEDEARLSASFAFDLFETEGRDYYHQWLIKERAVIRNVFDGEQALIDRFTVKFNDMTAPITNVYF